MASLELGKFPGITEKSFQKGTIRGFLEQTGKNYKEQIGKIKSFYNSIISEKIREIGLFIFEKLENKKQYYIRERKCYEFDIIFFKYPFRKKRREWKVKFIYGITEGYIYTQYFLRIGLNYEVGDIRYKLIPLHEIPPEVLFDILDYYIKYQTEILMELEVNEYNEINV